MAPKRPPNALAPSSERTIFKRTIKTADAEGEGDDIRKRTDCWPGARWKRSRLPTSARSPIFSKTWRTKSFTIGMRFSSKTTMRGSIYRTEFSARFGESTGEGGADQRASDSSDQKWGRKSHRRRRGVACFGPRRAIHNIKLRPRLRSRG